MDTAGSGETAASGRRRPAGRRGLTAAAGAVLLLAATGVGAALDLPDDVGLHAVFLGVFVAACAVVALAVHREDLRAAVVMPPLCFALAVCIVGAARGGDHSGALAGRVALGLAQPLVFGAPALLTGTAVALVVVLLRALAGRRR